MGAKLLLVEDDADSAEAMITLLTGEGYEVQWASTAGAGLSALTGSGAAAGSRGRPDVMLLDLTLPDMTAEEIAQALATQEPPPPPIVVLSAKQEMVLKQEALALHAAEVVRKPFELADLLSAIRRALQGASKPVTQP